MAGRIPLTLTNAMTTEPERPTDSNASVALPLGRIEGRIAFEDTIRLATEQAGVLGWQTMWWMDLDFADWPLGERRMEAALQAWSKTGRRMVLMAQSYDKLIARHHRFVMWRRQWAHIIECWVCPSADPSVFPSGILSPHWAMRRIDRDHHIAQAFNEPARILALHELRNEWQEKSAHGFPATVLGL